MTLAERIALAHHIHSLTESPYLKHIPRGRFDLREGVGFTGSNLPGPGFNFAACLQPCPPLREIVRMGKEFFGRDAWGVQVEGGAGHPIEAELTAAGWSVAEDEPAFVMSVIGSDCQPSNSVRFLETEADRVMFGKVATVAFEMPPEFADIMMPTLDYALDPDLAFFLIDADGETACVGGYSRTGETAMVICLATLPKFRGRGLGATLTRHALAHARDERNCVNSCLRSGPLSIPLYERLGYVYSCQHRTYAAPAASDEKNPPNR